MRDGVGQLFACLNGDGDVLVGRLQDVLLLGESAHGKHEERREKIMFFHISWFVFAVCKDTFFPLSKPSQKNNSVSLPLYQCFVLFLNR